MVQGLGIGQVKAQLHAAIESHKKEIERLQKILANIDRIMPETRDKSDTVKADREMIDEIIEEKIYRRHKTVNAALLYFKETGDTWVELCNKRLYTKIRYGDLRERIQEFYEKRKPTT